MRYQWRALMSEPVAAIQAALEAWCTRNGVVPPVDLVGSAMDDLRATVARLMREARAAEREACARVADGHLARCYCGDMCGAPENIAAAIRARTTEDGA